MKKTLAVLASLLLIGCAGRDFKRAEGDTLQLGRTTTAEIETRFGKPYRTGSVTKNDVQVPFHSYAYANAAGGDPAYPGVTPARAQGYYFVNGVLVGHEFSSSFRADSTDFDETKVSQLTKGKSTRDDVVALLGKPHGEYIHPMVAKDNTGLVYVYNQTTGSAFNLKFYQKILVVSVDAAGTVTDVNLTTSGTK